MLLFTIDSVFLPAEVVLIEVTFIEAIKSWVELMIEFSKIINKLINLIFSYKNEKKKQNTTNNLKFQQRNFWCNGLVDL